MLAYIFAFVVASAGAINYAFDADAHVYTVAGVLNGVFGILNTIRLYKTSRRTRVGAGLIYGWAFVSPYRTMALGSRKQNQQNQR